MTDLEALLEETRRTMSARREKAQAEGRLGYCSKCEKEFVSSVRITGPSACERCFFDALEASSELEERQAVVPKAYRVRTAERLAERGVDPRLVEVADASLLKSWVVIHGARSGAGKSSLAGYMACQRAAKMRDSILWLPSYKLAGSSWAADADWLIAQLLIIDDLGAERDCRSSLVPEVIEERRAHEMSTWITTAFDSAQLAEKYGEHVARRVYGRSTAIVIKG